MVRHEQVGAGVDGLADDRERRVDREVDERDRLLEITGDEPHLIPGLGPLRREQPLEHLDDLAQGRRIGGGGARRGSG